MHSRLLDISTLITTEPRESAEDFWNNNHHWQVEFFNELARLSGHRMCFQLQWVTDDPCLTPGARALMEKIGEYAYPHKL